MRASRREHGELDFHSALMRGAFHEALATTSTITKTPVAGPVGVVQIRLTGWSLHQIYSDYVAHPDTAPGCIPSMKILPPGWCKHCDEIAAGMVKEIAELQAETRERMRSDAARKVEEEEATRIVRNAEREAEQIRRKAQGEADSILYNAKLKQNRADRALKKAGLAKPKPKRRAKK